MTNEERLLLVETLAEMRMLKVELREFKEHVIGRVEKLEKKESERGRERLATISVVIALLALAANIAVNFYLKGSS